jgi:hypothetical protein
LGDEAQLKAYELGLQNPEGQIAPEVMVTAQRGWATFLSPVATAKRTVMKSLLTQQVMERLIKLGLGGEGYALLLPSVGEGWESYRDAVTAIFEEEIVGMPSASKEERQVRDLLLQKWRFVAMSHQNLHFQRPLPLLTPPLVAGLGHLVGKIPRALAEVS